jgi:hypothetical protein
VKRHSLDAWGGTGAWEAAFALSIVGGFLATAASSVSLLFLLYFLVPAAQWTMIATHDGNGLGGRAKDMLYWHKQLPPELQAEVPLTREWLREDFPRLESRERDAVYESINELYKAHRARMAEEERKLVAYKHVVESARAAQLAEITRRDDLKKINDDVKLMLDG